MKAQLHKLFYSSINNNLLDVLNDKKNKVAIITFENRNDSLYIDYHNTNVKEYCKKWSYDYLYYTKCDYQVYWCKMYFVLDALQSNKYDWVIWLDSDTIIKNKLISIDQIVNKYSSDILVTEDNGFTTFCAGVFMIKNTMNGINFIKDCIKSKKSNCEIKTKDKINEMRGIWAGMCYEQGIMNMLIYDKYLQYTTCLPKYIVYNGQMTDTNNICNYDTFILHLYSSKKNLRSDCFIKYIKNLK
jgi:hypothetical protein